MARALGSAPAHDQLALGLGRHLAVLVVHHAAPRSRRGAGRRRGCGSRAARWQSEKMRPVSVMPHTSTRGKPKRRSKASCSSGSTPAPRPAFTRCAVSSGDRRLVQQQRRHHAQVVDDGGARGDHVAPPAARAEALGQDQAVGGEDRAGRGHRLAVHVKERQRIEEALAPGLDGEPAAQAAVPGARVQVVEVAEHAALGPAGGARGVEQAALGVEPGRAAARRAARGAAASRATRPRPPPAAAWRARCATASSAATRSGTDTARSASECSIW